MSEVIQCQRIVAQSVQSAKEQWKRMQMGCAYVGIVVQPSSRADAQAFSFQQAVSAYTKRLLASLAPAPTNISLFGAL